MFLLKFIKVKGKNVLRYEFNPEVKLLLVNHSDEKVKMVYMEDSWLMSKIGLRPPYYCYPSYELNYPIILIGKKTSIHSMEVSLKPKTNSTKGCISLRRKCTFSIEL
ncbi:hypothetical protein AWM68_14415 [Fictibacillus phosphorivorans]|uniref:Uncharacterized protein n=1 Tax=Fictibacillus phosphorivorans TaxID=1221500 RepID=A0A165N1T8_9BACL|nr:hypothetical protein AWM68_14415 [Fictibacillus phosphorivorans]